MSALTSAAHCNLPHSIHVACNLCVHDPVLSSERGKLDPPEQNCPLFPRMDVNDKDGNASGIPRPPPRNKMALSLALPAHSYNITNALPPPSTFSNYAVNALPHPPLMMPLFIPSASSASQQVTTPIEAMAVIGQDAFHKLRNEMIQHQRLFVHQLMELHRLIEVQRHLAGYKHQQPEKPSSSRMLNLIEPQKGHNVQRQDNGSRPKPSSECVTEMLNLPPQRKDPFKAPLPIAPRVNQDAGMHAIAGGLNLPWIPPQPITGNQWLRPLIVPSEGLVYKPCPITPVPNPAGLVLPPIINTPKAVQMHYPFPHQSGTRPFVDVPFRGTPLLNAAPSVPSSQLASALQGSTLQPGSALNPNPSYAFQPSSIKSSWNPMNLARGLITPNINVPRLTRPTGDSTAGSSPPEAAQGYTLPLFPEEPANMALQNKHHQHRPNDGGEEQQKKGS